MYKLVRCDWSSDVCSSDLGFEFIGIEREPSYHAIAEQRIGRAAAAGYQPSLLP
jgi:DNA modification methylase